MDSGTPATTAAPKIEEVVKMMGALHVMWTRDEASCDSIEGASSADVRWLHHGEGGPHKKGIGSTTHIRAVPCRKRLTLQSVSAILR